MSPVRPALALGADPAPAHDAPGLPGVAAVPAATSAQGAPGHPRRARLESRWAWCLVWGLLAAASVGWLYRLFVQDPRGLLLDHAAFLGAGLGRARVQPVADLVLGFVSIRFLLVSIAVAVVVAVARRRWGDALRAVIVAGGANLTTQILKAALERPDTSALTDYTLANSLPSGHTTVAASVVAMAVLVVPRALRPWAALIGAGYVAATGVATISLAWHRPSDALAAIAVVTAWTLLVLAPARTRVPVGAAPSAVRPAVTWLLGIAAGTGLGIALATVQRTLDLAGSDLSSSSAALEQGAAQLTFAGSALGVGGAAALACWLVLLARR